MEATPECRRAKRGFTVGIGFVALMAFSGCGGAPPEIPIALSDFAFEPRQVAVPAGQRVSVVLQNTGSVGHFFAVPQLRVTSLEVAPGQTTKLEFAAPNGTYKLLCTVPGHEEAGMVGEVRVTRGR